MKLDYKLFKKLLLPLSALAFLSFCLRLYTYWKELEVTTGFFKGNGAGGTVFNIIAFAVFFLCLLLTYHKKGSSVGSSSSASSRVSEIPSEDSLLVQEEEEIYEEVQNDFPQFFLHGFAKKCAIWFGTFSAFAALLPGFALICHAFSFLLEKESLSDPYCLAYAAFALASGAYFLLYSFRNSSEKSQAVAFFALVPAFWCTLRLVIEYRDLTRYLNSSLYVGQFLFVISALVFFLYQAEILLGEDKLARPNAYVFSALSVAFLGLTARLPQLIAIMGERIHTDLYSTTTLLADLAVTVFVISKLIVTTKRK